MEEHLRITRLGKFENVWLKRLFYDFSEVEKIP